MESGKRIHLIKAKLTESEYQQFLALEKQLGLNRSQIIKARVLHDSFAVLVDARQLLFLLDRVGAELGRAGNNINQLARHANTLNKQGMLQGQVVLEFNRLFGQYLLLQRELDAAMRQLIRLMRP